MRIWILFKISIAACRASLIKMITSVHEGLTVHLWEFPKFSPHLRGVKILSFVSVRFEVIV